MYGHPRLDGLQRVAGYLFLVAERFQSVSQALKVVADEPPGDVSRGAVVPRPQAQSVSHSPLAQQLLGPLKGPSR